MKKNNNLNLILRVLNLVINGLPSILKHKKSAFASVFKVLNLVINGLPSIPYATAAITVAALF